MQEKISAKNASDIETFKRGFIYTLPFVASALVIVGLIMGATYGAFGYITAASGGVLLLIGVALVIWWRTRRGRSRGPQ